MGRLVVVGVTAAALACAERPFCLSGVTTYLEGAKGVTKERSIYGSASAPQSRGAEVRLGVALEWDPSGNACMKESE